MSTNHEITEDDRPGAGKRPLQVAATRVGLAVIIIAPLLYENIDLIRKGYHPSEAGLNIEFGQTMGTLEIEDDQGE